jgi:hypothetical protein
MSELYVANVTDKVHQFAYRAPERKGVVVQSIPPGQQILVAPYGSNTNLSQPVIDSILGQHDKYGLLPAENIDLADTSFYGICYSIDKPVKLAQMEKALAQNEKRLNMLGREMAEAAAVRVSNDWEEGAGLELRGLEMSVTEMEPKSGFRQDSKQFAEGVRVTRGSMELPPGEKAPLPSITTGKRR